MKKLFFVLAVLLSFASKADQLAYITQEQAEEAAAYINKHAKLYLFCGCCSMVAPQKVKVIEAKAMHTGYENYYEVEIKYEDDEGKIQFEKIDLAYVWKKKLFGYKTLGQIFDLDHDYCVAPKDWDDPANEEKDI